MNKASWLHIGRYGLLLLLSLFALKYLHFIIGGIVIIAAFMLAAGQRNLLKIGILAVSIPCLLYAALWYGLRIPLP